jgi:hypothetical protein
MELPSTTATTMAVGAAHTGAPFGEAFDALQRQCPHGVLFARWAPACSARPSELVSNQPANLPLGRIAADSFARCDAGVATSPRKNRQICRIFPRRPRPPCLRCRSWCDASLLSRFDLMDMVLVLRGQPVVALSADMAVIAAAHGETLLCLQGSSRVLPAINHPHVRRSPSFF